MYRIFILLILSARLLTAFAQDRDSLTSDNSLHFDNSLAPDIRIIKKHIFADYKGMFREAGGALHFPYITPRSNAYANDLWDWDSWLSDIALRQILHDNGSDKDKQDAIKYEQGCVLNFLSYTGFDGYMPILIAKKSDPEKIKPENIYATNMHKPVIAQHAAFLTRLNKGNAEWLRERFSLMRLKPLCLLKRLPAKRSIARIL